ncbi:MAG TPA: hypothetical protein VGH27_06555 [Streptosporangiaceae bacterium]
MTQVGQEPMSAAQARPEPGHDASPLGGPGASSAAPRGVAVLIEPGTLMEKLVPRHLVDPYLSSQRSVIAGFVHRVEDGTLAGLAWARGPGLTRAGGTGGAGLADEGSDLWVLRWRALQMQSYLASPPGGPGPAWLYMRPGAVPVDAEMYRITAAGEEFIARYDGQDWLHPNPRS